MRTEQEKQIKQIAKQIADVQRVISPLAFSLGQQINQIAKQTADFQRIVLPATIEMRKQIIDINTAISPAIIQAVQRTQELAEAINPIILTIGQDVVDFSRAFSPIISRLANTIKANCFDIERFSQALMEIDDTNDLWEGFEEKSIRLSEAEKDEIEKIAEDIVCDPLNWEQKLFKAFCQINEKHPISAKILLFILGTLITVLVNVTSSVIYETINQTKLREQPSTTSTIITIYSEKYFPNVE